MSYKIVFTDIDGTALTPDHQVTGRLRETVKGVREQYGVELVLVSARCPGAMQEICRDIGASDTLIGCAGAVIMEGNKEFYSFKLSSGVMWDTWKAAEEFQNNISFYQGNQWYVNKLDSWILQEQKITGMGAELVEIEPLLTEWEKKGTGANKILLTSDAAQIQKMAAILMKRLKGRALVEYSKQNYLEILPEGVDKGIAIETLCRMRGIDRSRVLAAGDERIDIPMLRFAGCGIAMGNANDEVKANAGFITKGNDEDGLAFALETLIGPVS